MGKKQEIDSRQIPLVLTLYLHGVAGEQLENLRVDQWDLEDLEVDQLGLEDLEVDQRVDLWRTRTRGFNQMPQYYI